MLADNLSTDKYWQERYPAFVLPSLLRLTSGAIAPGSEDEAREAARVGATLRDPMTLRDLLGKDPALLANFYPEQLPQTPSTSDTIDTFLASFGATDPRETDALTKAIFNPTPDYAAVLAAKERDSAPTAEDMDESKVGAHQAAVNRFIARTRQEAPKLSEYAKPETEAEKPQQPAPAAEKPEEAAPAAAATAAPEDSAAEKRTAAAETKSPDSGTLSESFARVMIKNRNYSKALEIISELSLNNPEKSVYFADQIRFLRKLILIQNRKKG